MASNDRNEWKARIDRALSELKTAEGPSARMDRDEKRPLSESSSESAAR